MAFFLLLLSLFTSAPHLLSAQISPQSNVKPLYRFPSDDNAQDMARVRRVQSKRKAGKKNTNDEKNGTTGNEESNDKQSPSLSPSATEELETVQTATGEPFLVGTSKGLFKVAGTTAIPIAQGELGKVEQIVRTKMPIVRAAGELHDGTDPTAPAMGTKWYFRTSKGIISSSDLKTFTECNKGLASLVVKKFIDGKATLVNQSAMLKDLAADPLDNRNMVTATENAVFVTQDGGEVWKSIGSVSDRTPGIKAVAIATMADGKTAVFLSHTIFGFAYMVLDDARPVWHSISGGIKIMASLTSTDEVADIYPMLRYDAEGKRYTEVYLSQSYLPNIYRLDWDRKTCISIYAGSEPCDTLDAITSIGGTLLFSRIEGLGAINVDTMESPGLPANLDKWKASFAAAPGFTNCAYIPSAQSGFNEGVTLGELWLLTPGTLNTPYSEKVDGKKCVYVSAYQCREKSGRDKFRKIIKDNGLNALVIDMKDDYGFLRYDTRDPLVMKKGRVTQYKIDLDKFVEEFKEDNVYLVARIVVFKDKNLSHYNGGECAVWDSKNNAPWVGVRNYDGEEGVEYYDENWVDPYSPFVWEYNVAIAKELASRGFDEIQFDYIRFPTDGLNMKNATYRAKSAGMTKESALISFLSYARENIDAPLGIDIYGANGWYRSGTRTGQDSEMLAEYVDVVGAMFYPSHFENSFMNCAPYADRPYRIYFYGTYRNTVMMRNRAIARPWVQAFKLGVTYDRQYYGPEYIQREIFGVRDAASRGYMYWNNAGDYSNLRPDVKDDDKYIGTDPAADSRYRRPAIGKTKRDGIQAAESDDDGLSILDTVRLQDSRREREGQYTPFLIVPVKSPFESKSKG